MKKFYLAMTAFVIVFIIIFILVMRSMFKDLEVKKQAIDNVKHGAPESCFTIGKKIASFGADCKYQTLDEAAFYLIIQDPSTENSKLMCQDGQNFTASLNEFYRHAHLDHLEPETIFNGLPKGNLCDEQGGTLLLLDGTETTSAENASPTIEATSAPTEPPVTPEAIDAPVDPTITSSESDMPTSFIEFSSFGSNPNDDCPIQIKGYDLIAKYWPEEAGSNNVSYTSYLSDNAPTCHGIMVVFWPNQIEHEQYNIFFSYDIYAQIWHLSEPQPAAHTYQGTTIVLNSININTQHILFDVYDVATQKDTTVNFIIADDGTTTVGYPNKDMEIGIAAESYWRKNMLWDQASACVHPNEVKMLAMTYQDSNQTNYRLEPGFWHDKQYTHVENTLIPSDPCVFSYAQSFIGRGDSATSLLYTYSNGEVFGPFTRNDNQFWVPLKADDDGTAIFFTLNSGELWLFGPKASEMICQINPELVLESDDYLQTFADEGCTIPE